MKRCYWLGVIIASLAGVISCAGQTTLSGHLNVDNAFTVYLSTDDSVPGTSIASGSSWSTTESFSNALTPGVVNYLHIEVTDAGAPAGFLGSFSLTGTSFHFVNGTQALVTTPADWLLSPTGFGSNYGFASSQGTNGVSPWGLMSNVAPNAEWLLFPDATTAYFSTAITPIPEPAAAAAVMAAAVIGVGIRARRRWLAKTETLKS